MSRWRLTTWLFLIFNVVMVGVVLLLLWSTVGPSPPVCDHLSGNDRTACAMAEGLGGGYQKAIQLLFGLGTVAIVWPIGLIIIATAWLRGRGG